MEIKLASLKEETKFDPSQFKVKIKEVEGQLDTQRAIKSALTGASGKIDNAKNDLKKMESSIREILGDIQVMINKGN